MRLLAKEPDDRYQSGGEVVAVLKRLLADPSIWESQNKSLGHLATVSGRHYATLSLLVFCCNDLMTGAARMTPKAN